MRPVGSSPPPPKGPEPQPRDGAGGPAPGAWFGFSRRAAGGEGLGSRWGHCAQQQHDRRARRSSQCGIVQSVLLSSPSLLEQPAAQEAGSRKSLQFAPNLPQRRGRPRNMAYHSLFASSWRLVARHVARPSTWVLPRPFLARSWGSRRTCSWVSPAPAASGRPAAAMGDVPLASS
jgi:hypothetical protein